MIQLHRKVFLSDLFATYSQANGPDGFQKSLVQWMDEHKDLRMMIEEEDKLEWYRQVTREIEHSEGTDQRPITRRTWPLIRTIMSLLPDLC